MRKNPLIALGLALWPCAAMAQRDTISLSAVEVVAPTVVRGVTSTAEVQSMGRDDMQRLGLDNVAEAVKRFAGVSVKDYGGIGGVKTVSIHNLGAHHTAVSYDGVTVSNTQAGQIDIGRYDTDNLEQLSLHLGSEDNLMLAARQYAAAATLSMVTARPRFAKGRAWQLRARVDGGSYGLLSPALGYARRLGQRTVATAYGKYTRADGNYPFTLRNGTLRTREQRHNTDYEAWRGEANVYHTLADSSRLEAKVGWFYSRRGLPGTVILYVNGSEERLWDEDFFVQATYRRRLAERLRLAARLKYTHSWNRYRDWGSQYADGVRTDVNRQSEYYGSATLGWTVAPGLEAALAQDVSRNTLKNNVYVNVNYDVPRPSRWTSVTALALKWRTSRLRVNGSMAYTYAAEHVAVGEAPADKRRLTPALSVSYRLLPGHQLFVRAMWKHTFRVPTFNDLYYRRLGNIHLRPELAREYGVGLAWNTRHRAMRYLAVTVDGYYNKVKDKIVAFPSTYVWRMANYGKVHIVGVDMTLGTQVDLAPQWSVKASASATWQRAVDKTLSTSQTYDNQLPYTPRWSGSGSLVVATPWLHVGYSVVMQGSRYSMGQNKPEYRMRPFWDHGVTLGRDLTVGRSTLHLQFKVTNLTHAQYEIIQYYPMPGRQFAASVGVDL